MSCARDREMEREMACPYVDQIYHQRRPSPGRDRRHHRARGCVRGSALSRQVALRCYPLRRLDLHRVLLLGAVATLASYIPARAAARVQPPRALSRK
jgi:hypothetical protein